MKLLSRKDIDVEKWDDCVTHSINTKPYGLSYWLDCVAPGWCGYVVGDYQAVMPVYHRSFLWTKRAAQPLFTQQLGLFMREPEYLSFLTDILNQLKTKYRHGYLQLNEANFSEDVNSNLKHRKNYKIQLTRLNTSNYSKSHLRNLKKARNSGLMAAPMDTDSFIQAYRQHNPVYTSQIRRHKGIFEGLIKITAEKGIGRAIAVLDGQTCLAAVWFVTFRDTAYYLLPFTSKTGRDLGAMHLLISDLPSVFPAIKVLDFEGSELPGVERFILGFDAQLHPYPTFSW